jgi:hypothetical protein
MTASPLDLFPKDIDMTKNMVAAQNGYGAGKEFKLPEFIHIAGTVQGNQTR